MPIQTCFESSQEEILFRFLTQWNEINPDSSGVLLDDWLRAQFGLLNSADRLALAQTFRKTDLPAEEWLPTVELLRSSLILNSEQMTHCFSVLPATKKNKALKECFSFYLQSKLVEDKASLLWEWIGELKSGRSSRFGSADVCLVPTEPSTFLFQDLCENIQRNSHPSQVSTQAFSHLLGNHPFESVKKTQWGTTVRALNGLAETVCRDLENHPQKNVIITFWGKAESKAYLMGRLSSLGFVTDDLMGSLRPKTEHTQLKPRISIAPWITFPSLQHFLCYSFCDESLAEAPESDSLLSDQELEQLFYAGFQIPRWHNVWTCRLNTLKATSCLSHYSSFTSLSQEHLEQFAIQEISLQRHRMVQPEENYRASLPIKSFSATQLETYSDCPSKYLYRRLKLNESHAPLSKFALELGQAVHLTLETLFSQVPSYPLNESLLRETFHLCLQKTVPAVANRHALSPFYEKAFERILPHIIHLEQSLRGLFGPSSQTSVEKEFEIKLHGTSFIGKIDRVDVLQDNSLLVLDYKTGSVDFTPEQITRGENFQALLYWLGAQDLFKREPAAMLFYDLKKGEAKRGLAREDLIESTTKKAITRGHTLTPEKLNSLIESGIQALLKFSALIQQGEFSPVPSIESCRFCEATSFCRKAVDHV